MASEQTNIIHEQDNAWQHYKRLMRYVLNFRFMMLFAIVGMLGYAGVDALFIKQLQPLIDEGLSGSNPDFMYWAPYFVVALTIARGIFNFISMQRILTTIRYTVKYLLTVFLSLLNIFNMLSIFNVSWQ